MEISEFCSIPEKYRESCLTPPIKISILALDHKTDSHKIGRVIKINPGALWHSWHAFLVKKANYKRTINTIFPLIFLPFIPTIDAVGVFNGYFL